MKTIKNIIGFLFFLIALIIVGTAYLWLGSWLITGIFAVTFTAVQFLKLNVFAFLFVTLIRLFNK